MESSYYFFLVLRILPVNVAVPGESHGIHKSWTPLYIKVHPLTLQDIQSSQGKFSSAGTCEGKQYCISQKNLAVKTHPKVDREASCTALCLVRGFNGSTGHEVA